MTCEFTVGEKVRALSWDELVEKYGVDSHNGLNIRTTYTESILSRITNKEWYVSRINRLGERWELCISSNDDGDNRFYVDSRVFEKINTRKDGEFYVGDKVRILRRDEFTAKYGEDWRDLVPFGFNTEMDEFFNQEFIITGLSESRSGTKVEGLTTRFSIHTEMLKLVEPKLESALESEMISVSKVIKKLEKLIALHDQDLMVDSNEFTKLVLNKWVTELKGGA